MIMNKELYQIRKENNAIILLVRDLISEYANRQILEVAQTQIDAGQHNFVVDLSEIPYMNSVGLNFLILLHNRLKESEGKLAIANASPKIIQLLDVTKLLPIFQITKSVDEGLKALRA